MLQAPPDRRLQPSWSTINECGDHGGRRIHQGVAQPGSARALGARGRGFESHHPDQYFRYLAAGGCLKISEFSSEFENSGVLGPSQAVFFLLTLAKGVTTAGFVRYTRLVISGSA